MSLDHAEERVAGSPSRPHAHHRLSLRGSLVFILVSSVAAWALFLWIGKTLMPLVGR